MDSLPESRPLGELVDGIFLGLALSRQPKGSVQTRPALMVNVKDIIDGVLIHRSNLSEVEVPGGSQTDRFKLVPGDVLISARGSIKVAGVHTEHGGAIAGANLIVVRPGKLLAAPLVLAFLRDSSTRTTLERLSAGTTVQSINVKTVAELRVTIPPAETQHKLSRLVGLADEQYLAARRAAEIRRELAQVVAIRALAA